MSGRIRVVLADDHAMMRAGFRTILTLDDRIEVVGEAGTGAEAIAQARALRPDVVCMDVQMPDLDGLEATRRIIADPDIPSAVLVVTTFDRDDYLFAALDAGASGFLLKNAGPEELTAAVRVVAGGDALLAPEVTRRVIARFANSAVSASAPEPLPVSSPLTEREEEVLRLMADALSNGEIAERLYIGEATVKTHVSNVLAKLGARDRVQAVVLAHRHGLA
ncbi:DNA-binding NarL/FixJ family response regulator [Microbacterium sp. SORGH_AS428]|uniref:response regulator transcription factor n=1 Tax=Microbacterium sp. SORGH_AS_0428 TaxID=3041788 RepID=UPI0028542BF1|nr:response regulator transcription factor [Microbacterium sp. SORGH_AS_0428]MDR6199719.1 DNA-binding NarL/FixJ family response regulator [Microbacterium sp. SORGH_AS_0428]